MVRQKVKISKKSGALVLGFLLAGVLLGLWACDVTGEGGEGPEPTLELSGSWSGYDSMTDDDFVFNFSGSNFTSDYDVSGEVSGTVEDFSNSENYLIVHITAHFMPEAVGKYSKMSWTVEPGCACIIQSYELGDTLEEARSNSTVIWGPLGVWPDTQPSCSCELAGLWEGYDSGTGAEFVMPLSDSRFFNFYRGEKPVYAEVVEFDNSNNTVIVNILEHFMPEFVSKYIKVEWIVEPTCGCIIVAYEAQYTLEAARSNLTETWGPLGIVCEPEGGCSCELAGIWDGTDTDMSEDFVMGATDSVFFNFYENQEPIYGSIDSYDNTANYMIVCFEMHFAPDFVGKYLKSEWLSDPGTTASIQSYTQQDTPAAAAADNTVIWGPTTVTARY